MVQATSGEREAVCDHPGDPTIEKLCDLLFNTIDEFAQYHRLTTGQAMGALFAVLVRSAKASPEYDPKRLVEEIDARIREAVGLQ